jgi:hypothetical protein
MCSGGRLIADFVAGTDKEPQVPGQVTAQLTRTVDGSWVVWAHKVASMFDGERFLPMSGGRRAQWYPADARAACAKGLEHEAPQRRCSCGFHAVSSTLPFAWDGFKLDVVLSGRVLAFEWLGGGVLFRAARQTVVNVRQFAEPARRGEDPDGRAVRRATELPRGAGPMRLALPTAAAPLVEVADDAGYCIAPTLPSELTASKVSVLV